MNKQLYVPLITPMSGGEFDEESYKKLMASVEPFVDGYVPCLSSGEGHMMSIELWKKVLLATLAYTKKPVFVGIKRKTKQEVFEMLDIAKSLGAHGITIPVLCEEETDIESYLTELSVHSQLPIIIYNTETVNISEISLLQRIEKLWNIIWIKDSSGNKEFFKNMLEAKKQWNLSMKIFQGMENELHSSLNSNWFLIALANVEPELCSAYLKSWNPVLLEKIKELRSKYNLWWNRYITLKAILMMRWVISSAEEVNALSYS